MSKRSELPQSRRHILILDEDWEFLEDRYGSYSDNRIGTGTACKHIIHAHVKRLRQREAEAAQKEQI